MTEQGEKTSVLVTGASGMIGSRVVQGLLDRDCLVIGLDKKPASQQSANYRHLVVDLSDKVAVDGIFSEMRVDRVIHLAALAHTAGETDLSWEAYYLINVVNSIHVFDAAARRKIPILYSSTADVYGFVKGVATADTPLHPVGHYGKSKALAEMKLKDICLRYRSPYTIMRFAPVYSETQKRDILKRYYLKYPNWAFIVGKGTAYEVLDIQHAVDVMCAWIYEVPRNDTRNIKNAELQNTADWIKEEKAAGRAKHVLPLPRWLTVAGFAVMKGVMGQNKTTYLLNKAVHPLRTH